ncbi:hypothetical protein [Pseudomonas sp. BW7P1]|uniref:hypothetical protein n=1 Tax=Pseudomonas TaxID=286 RepID=UPI0021AD6025|nr:hypothetical protein [Pseudomonas sp. BW7P1]UWI61318.1 hypothetical protein NWV16_25085 [Pseudomonas sp. BW7P1]
MAQATPQGRLLSMPQFISSHLKSTGMAATLCLCLTGCVGAIVSLPEKTTLKTDAYKSQYHGAITPRISRTVTSTPTREWCGITLWALVIPVPLKLPVCTSFSEQSIGHDELGKEVVMLDSQQKVPSPFYACGPFMVLGPIVHGYQGNALCGVFPD